MNDIRFRKLVAVLSLFAASGALATVGYAQATTSTTTTTVESEQKPEVLEKYIVTGSNIPQAADALAIPVATVDLQTIDMSGISSDTLDLLRKVAPNISGIGQENAQINTASNFGGASVNIKGLPTLVLINGRRVATDPAESTGGFQFVDLNVIPVAAVERFEVLQDGASAIYGSDAIGGVINIILKTNYNGWETGAHYGISTGLGHYEERSGYLVGGVSNDKTSLTVSLDYAQHNSLFLSDRSYTNPIYGTYTAPGGSIEIYDNFSGSDNFYHLAPGVSAPPGGGGSTISQLTSSGVYVPKTATQQFQSFNLAAGETLIGSLKRYSAMVNMEHKIFGNALQGFANVLFSNTHTYSQLNAQPLVPYLLDPWVSVNVYGLPGYPPPAGINYAPTTNPGNPFSTTYMDQGAAGALIPESGPGNGDGSGLEVLVRDRYTQYPRQYISDGEFFRGVGGLKGDFSDDIHWEAAADINRYQLNYTNPGLWDTAALNAAWASGALNPFAASPPNSAFTGIVGTAFVNMLSTLNAFDVKLDGTPYELPGGKLGFAIGFNYVRESLSAVPDVNSLPNSSGTTQGWANATTFQQFEAVRSNTSEFAELSVPVTGPKQNIPGAHSINVDAAVRYDDYSGNVGSTTDPEVNISWAPVDDQFKFRASAGKSFIAPALYSLYGPVSSGSTDSITYTTASGGTKSAQFNQTGGANPLLKPTTAKSWSAGFVYTPKVVSGLTVTVDYSRINQKEIPGTVPADTIIQDVELKGTASPYIGDVHYNTPTGPTPSGPGGISGKSPQQIYVIANLINLGGQKINSTDINIDYVKKVAGVGTFDLTSVWTWYNNYQLELIPTQAFYEYSGTASKNEGTIPKWRTYTTLDWKYSGLEAFVGVTWIDSVNDWAVGGAGATVTGTIPSFNSIDLGASYDFAHLHLHKTLDGLKVKVGVNNVQDKQPPIAIDVFPNTNADVGTYNGAIGRMYYVEASYSF
jgi:iron complex outermembrane receptor protein